MGTVAEADTDRFERFAATAEPRLRRVLVAWYGVDVGAQATADAMGHAWEHFDEVEAMENPVGYLFRVGQSKSRWYRRRFVRLPAVPVAELPDVDPRLPGALARLSQQQRAAVLLVHAYGWTYADAGGALACSVSTLRNHLERGMRRLRDVLGEHDG
jgi:DNA-directed RNA polymerase specialized sigma24 family protein